MGPIPRTIDEVTPAWLTSALRQGQVIDCNVTSTQNEEVGSGLGALSTMVRSRLSYDTPSGDEPGAVIVKLLPQNEAELAGLRYSHGFEREIRFYREVASGNAFAVPRFYYGTHSGDDGVLVIEDLSHLETRNQIHGLKDSETLAAARQIAKIHARFWNRREPAGFDWMPVLDDQSLRSYADGWQQFEEVYGVRVGHEAVALGRRLGRALDWLRAECARRPLTVCHNDFRADNLFFAPAGSGAPDVVIFDWQLCTWSLGALDVARLLGGSEPAVERKHHAFAAFNAWYEVLRAEGVTDYPNDEAFRDLRLGALMNLCLPVHVLAKWGPDSGGRQGQLLDAIATRIFPYAVEIGAGDIVPVS